MRLYIHIPFCKRRCHYCDFYSCTAFTDAGEYFDAVRQEALLRRSEAAGLPLGSIYFGGGTPSAVDSAHIAELLATVGREYGLADNPEITVEANPDDITPQWLRTMRQAGVNRLSIGVQSFNDDELQRLNRRHDAKQARHSVKMATDAGFDNCSIDLMYGLPHQDLHSWEYSIEQAIALNISHISAYMLTWHPNTEFWRQLRNNMLSTPDDELCIRQFRLLKRALTAAGYLHYEISNFARPHRIATHNTAYWRNEPYIGIGPSAHSYDGTTRRWNVADMPRYIRQINARHKWWESETLTLTDKYNDLIITSLRTMWGVSKLTLKNLNPRFSTHFSRTVEQFIADGSIVVSNDSYILSDNGMLLSDHIMEELMFVPPEH
jgi:oxygen-independent coproporphyrinogen-3 oxidase